MQNYHNFGSINSDDGKHDNLQIYLSLKDQIMSNYFSLNYFKRHVIYVEKIKNDFHKSTSGGIFEFFCFFGILKSKGGG